MIRKYIKTFGIKIILSIFCIFLYSTSINAQNLDYESIKFVVQKYTGIDGNEAENYPITYLVAEAIKIFDNSVLPISKNDLDMLHGVNGGNGVLDYILKTKGLTQESLGDELSNINIAMRRFLSISIWNIDKTVSQKELIIACLKTINYQKIPESDIYFILGDHFLLEFLSYIEKVTDYKEQAVMLEQANFLIQYIHGSKDYIKQDRYWDELQKAESKYEQIKKTSKETLLIDINRVYTKEEIMNSINKVYGDRPWFKGSLSMSAIINFVIAEMLYKDKQIDPTEMDLLIGSGGLYYYIVQVTEFIEEDSPMKRHLMGIVYLLADRVDLSQESFTSMEDIYCQKWQLFNKNFGKDNLPLNDIQRGQTLPERYINIIKNSKKPRINTKINRIRPLKIK